MIKIKLTESRTLPVSRELVTQLEPIYKKAFLKLAEVFILDELDSGGDSAFYNSLLDKLYKNFPELEGANIPIDKNFLYSLIKRMNAADKEERSLQITEIPIPTLIKIFESDSDNPLETFLRGRMSKRTAVNKIKKYFKDRDIDSLGINIELQKVAEKNQREEETYSGLYLADIGAISIVFEAAFFTGIVLTNQEGRRLRLSPRLSADAKRKPESIIDYIKDELEELPISIRHELQHFYQSLFSAVFGTRSFGVGNVPQQVSKRALGKQPDYETLPHHMHPVEMQTDIQDEIDKFTTSLNKFKSDNSERSDVFPAATKLMLKIFIGSELTMPEKRTARELKLHNYVLNGSDLLRTIRSDDKSGELYKYALRTLYSSVSDQLQESTIMDKIKIVLSENQLLAEELTKDEIRKLVRDELEKMLDKTETRKEIAKITKEFMKKFYRELSTTSTYVVDRVDV